MERTMEEDVIRVSEKVKPKLAQLFENILWINSPKEWVFNSLYFKGTLFIAILTDKNKSKKIRRSFSLVAIRNREEDLWGLALDCIDEMKNNG